MNFQELWHQAYALGAQIVFWPSMMATPDRDAISASRLFRYHVVANGWKTYGGPADPALPGVPGRPFYSPGTMLDSTGEVAAAADAIVVTAGGGTVRRCNRCITTDIATCFSTVGGGSRVRAAGGVNLSVTIVAAVVGWRWVAVTATSTVAARHSAVRGQAFTCCIHTNANANANTNTSTGRGSSTHASTGWRTDGRVRLTAADVTGALAATSRPKFRVIDGVAADGGKVT